MIFDKKGMGDEVQHMISYDSRGNLLEGHKEYVLHLPANIPASEFWSIIVYDSSNRLMIRTDQSWPSIYSKKNDLVYNSDGSVDIWFSPKPVKGKRGNWVKTVRGQQWFTILRLYYPLESWFDKSWRPGEIQELI
jgi:hypothetical protein